MTASWRVVFVSDSHLSARAAGSDLNWSAVAAEFTDVGQFGHEFVVPEGL